MTAASPLAGAGVANSRSWPNRAKAGKIALFPAPASVLLAVICENTNETIIT